jgi:hypothetical protein
MNIDITTTSAGGVLLVVLLTAALFGFLPRLATRLMSRAFPKSDPRRDEMLAELHGVPHFERLVWVAEQFERVLLEAIPARVAQSKKRREIWTVHVDGKEFRLSASRRRTLRERFRSWRYSAKIPLLSLSIHDQDDAGIGTATDQLITRVLTQAGMMTTPAIPLDFGFRISRIAVNRSRTRDEVVVSSDGDASESTR